MASASDEVILSEEEIEALTLAFNQYDLDRSGEIDRYEFKAALTAMGNAKITDDCLTKHMNFLDKYRSREWEQAKILINELVSSSKELALYYEHMKLRIDEFTANPPPAGWEGVYVAQNK